MKILMTAIALVIASPAVAQTAPAQAPEHGQHRQHGQGQHQGHAPQPGQTPHQGHGEQGGCCADRNGNGRMDCCERMAAGSSCCAERTPQPAPAAQPQGHSGH